MLTYVYIGSVGPFENVYVNKNKKNCEFVAEQKWIYNSKRTLSEECKSGLINCIFILRKRKDYEVVFFK